MTRPKNSETNPEIKTSTTTRKIGKTTYIVSSNYAENNHQDLVSVIARLIQSDVNLVDIADTAKSA